MVEMGGHDLDIGPAGALAGEQGQQGHRIDPPRQECPQRHVGDHLIADGAREPIGAGRDQFIF